MTRALRTFAGIALPLAAVSLLGCQSPWQSGTPVPGDAGWFSWMTTSERTGGDPLERLAGGGSYSPGVAEADSGAERTRRQLYGDRTSQLDLSREGATPPDGLAANSTATKTLAEALPSEEDDAASRVARSLQSRYQRVATPAVAEIAESNSTTDGAVAPAGYQTPAGPTVISSSTGTTARPYVDTAPSGAESNPFYDPFGEGKRTAPASTSSGGSTLRLLTTPSEPVEEPTPTISVPDGSSGTPSRSLMRLLEENSLR